MQIQELINAGLCIFKADPKTKAPLEKWTERAKNRYLDATGWNGAGVGVICGEPSGGLEVVDFDVVDGKTAWNEFLERLKETEHAEIISQNTFVQQTQSGGWHLCYRVERPGRNQKLATKNGKTLIETRGAGGYILCAPTEGYTAKSPIENLGTIPDEARDAIMRVARSFDSEAEQYQDFDFNTLKKQRIPENEIVFNSGKDESWVLEILSKHGWTVGRGGRDGNTILCRPGKQRGHSATLKTVNNVPYLYVFSSNAQPFHPGTAYRPMAIYTLLERDGNFGEVEAEVADETAESKLSAIWKVNISAIRKIAEPPAQDVKYLIESGEKPKIIATFKDIKYWNGLEEKIINTWNVAPAVLPKKSIIKAWSVISKVLASLKMEYEEPETWLSYPLVAAISESHERDEIETGKDHDSDIFIDSGRLYVQRRYIIAAYDGYNTAHYLKNRKTLTDIRQQVGLSETKTAYVGDGEKRTERFFVGNWMEIQKMIMA